MNKNIKSIIDDLYAIYPIFKKQEKDLEKLVEKLIEAKPDIKMDKVFVSGLRRSLSAKADEMSTATPKKFGFLNFIYAFGGTAITLVIIVSIFGQNKVGVPMPNSKLEFNINDITDEPPVDVDIEVLPIIKTQKALVPIEEQLKSYGGAVEEQSIEPQEPIDSPSIERSIDDYGDESEGAEENSYPDGGSSAAFFDMPMSGAVESTLDEPEIGQYYLDLLEVCGTRSKPDCCIASVETMIAGQYLSMTADGCADGFKMGMLDCGSDIRWCKPE